MIGVIGAMKVEVDNICKALTSYEIKQIAGRDFYVGNLYNLPIVVVESGIGKVNAAVTTAIMCENFDVDVIINTGVAGGVSGVKPLDLVIELKEIGEVIGAISVGKDEDDTAFIGYCLSDKYWGQGIMSEALKAFISYLFDNHGICF